ncbi:phage portal protein [Galbitalea sp. SE-J8]|uniref:phage portal protein n=1 Tax=Galbitalea sp. SE-J8 TaxID=3054952 RepID=UPI00259CA51E|nr:phage portal protein [Galbitalea sp. SE-J8]MDM4761891.1 phage portal protein [Galbitalea sp. SE-J8]
MENALRLGPVYAASGLIADMLASTPWAAFRESGDVPQRLSQQPQLVTGPGVKVDLYAWKFQLAVSCLLRGNAYGLVTAVDYRGIPSAISWLNPEMCDVDDDNGDIYFEGRKLDRQSVIHVPGYLLPGHYKGLSPLGLFKEQMETGMEAQRFGRKFFNRGAVPTAILKNTEKSLSPVQAEVMKRRFVASVSESEPFVTGADWDYKAISVPQGEVQFLAGIKATANQIAAIYRVAPEDVGGETGGSTLKYASLEQDLIRFNIRTLRPWATRFESAFDAYMPGKDYLRFNLDAGVRADIKSRFEAHAIALNAGIEFMDEVRALEERPPATEAQRAEWAARQSKGVKPQTPRSDNARDD